MSNKENMKIWDKVKKTDRDFAKEVSFGRKYTAISPQYQAQEATKVFGPYGKGWGFESCKLDMSHLDALNLVMVEAVFFYVEDGQRHTFPINNSWPINSGKKIDPDFAKKAETNTLSKALSRLGFNADVFMGMFDDPDYVEMVASEKAIEKAEDKVAEKALQDKKVKDSFEKDLQNIRASKSLGELEGTYKVAYRKAELYKNQAQIDAVVAAKDDKKAEFN